jgi:prepilin-type N-terminal cleavage/methylation domain-containing protein
MEATAMSRKTTNAGFSLMEVMAALSLFAVFFVVFASVMIANKNDSMELSEDLEMLALTERVLQETILSQTSFSDSLTTKGLAKKFEEPEFADYEYELEWATLELPNLKELFTMGNQGEGASGTQSSTSSLPSVLLPVLDQVDQSLKKMIWQLRVALKKKSNGKIYTLSTWLRNEDIQWKMKPANSAATTNGAENSTSGNSNDPPI